MPINVDPSYVDYSGGTSRYIVPIYSTKTLKKFYEATVLSEICNTDYLGEIKNAGDTVVIRTDPDITIRNYSKGQSLLLEHPESPAFELTIRYAKYFNFALDDIDVKQFDMDRIDSWASNSAKRMKIVIETELFAALALDALTQAISPYNRGNTAGYRSGNINLGSITSGLALTRNNILDTIVYAGQCLDELAIPNDGNRWMVIPAWASSLIKLSELRDASISGLGQSTLLNGRIGKLADFTLYTSNLLPTTLTDNGTRTSHNIFFGHKDALSFATQLVKTEKYRPHNTFAEAMKGLQVYGFEIVQPTCIGKILAYQGT